MRRRACHLAITVLAAFGPACVGSPQPDLPNLDPSKVSVVPTPINTAYGVDVVGNVGAASGGNVVYATGGPWIWFVNFDDTAPAGLVPVSPDGSFRVSGVGRIGDEVRLQVRTSERRGPPFDLVLATPYTAPNHPLASCLTTQPADELDLGNASAVGEQVDGTVQVVNGCAGALTLQTAFRVTGEGFEVIDAPSTLAAGASTTITVRYTASAGVTEAEEILFVHVLSPEDDRRAITVRAGGPG